MKIKTLLSKEITKKILCIVMLSIIAILSMTVISKIAISPESYSSTIQSIDNKKAAVMGVTATSAITSTALAAIPGEATTPIANKILDLSSYLLIVVCALVLEKSLLTVMGFLSFKILLPVSCLLFGIHIFIKKNALKILATKLLVFALIIVLIIPISIKLSDMIYEANKMTVTQVSADIDELSDNNNTDASWLNKTINKVKEGVANVGEEAKKILNGFIDAIALFIITSCVLPIAIIFIVIWLINFLFKVNISTPNLGKIVTKINPRRKEKHKTKNIEDKKLIEA